MTRGVVIILGVAAAVLAFIVYQMHRGGSGLRGSVPYYTPGAPNVPGGPPLPGSNKLSTYLQGVTATTRAAGDLADSLTSLWQKTGKSWAADSDTYDEDFVNNIPSLQS